MPNCKKCKKYFPSTCFIDGKKKDFRRRTICFECSPFNAKKTGTHKKRELNSRTFKCKTCGEIKTQKTRNNECTTCSSIRKRTENKKRAIEYKGGKCYICGYNKCINAFDFHHLDNEEKDFTISSSWLKAWPKIEKELDKCVLLCATCHREVHAGLILIEGDKSKKIYLKYFI